MHKKYALVPKMNLKSLQRFIDWKLSKQVSLKHIPFDLITFIMLHLRWDDRLSLLCALQNEHTRDPEFAYHVRLCCLIGQIHRAIDQSADHVFYHSKFCRLFVAHVFCQWSAFKSRRVSSLATLLWDNRPPYMKVIHHDKEIEKAARVNLRKGLLQVRLSVHSVQVEPLTTFQSLISNPSTCSVLLKNLKPGRACVHIMPFHINTVDATHFMHTFAYDTINMASMIKPCL